MNGIDSLKTKEEFSAVFDRRDSKADPVMVLYKADGTGKLGIIASKKYGNSVERHRFRRLVREAYRKHKDYIAEDQDMIVVARQGAKGLEFSEMERSFLTLLKRHSIYKNGRTEVSE